MTAFTDSDYEALEAAVMETPRGRWFLNEHARRSRAGDTQVLLAAIRKLERGMAGLNPSGGSAEFTAELESLSQAVAAALSQIAASALEPHDEAQSSAALEALRGQLADIKARLDALIGAERPGGESALTPDNLSYFGGDEDLFGAPGDAADAAEPAPAPSMALNLVDNVPPPDGRQQPASPPEPATDAAEPGSDKERILFIRRASSDQTSIPLADEPAEAPADSRPARGG